MKRALGFAGALIALAAAIGAAASRQESFPHARHERLFPLCEGCHGDMRTGEAAPAFPDPAACVRCHDGTREARVDWRGPSEHPSNLRFSHGTHRDAAGRANETPICSDCHAGDRDGRMSVERARAGACLECHAHAATEHLAPARDCLVCHVPLADAVRLGPGHIDSFPRPTTHEAEDFAYRHAPEDVTAARCSVCHARDTCTVCHANAANVPAIAALRSDARVAERVRGRMPAYPRPADHADVAWDVLHGQRAAQSVSACANCHTREGCVACHGPSDNAALEELPVRSAGDRRGVTVARRAAVHVPGYAERHGIDAAARESTCASCHEREQCESCHVGAATPSFHLPDFLATHGPAAYAADTECVSCHSTEVFCRSCHADTGLGARDQLGTAFHTSNPFWLVGHGVAARQGLETCATCHAQQSCMRCHAATGSWRISPHGPGFDAARAQAANPVTCRLCHRAGTVR